MERDLLWQGPQVRTHCVASSGGAQGCPLSGSLFIAVMGLVLRRGQRHFFQRRAGMTRARADDLAFALRSAQLAADPSTVMEEAERVTRLRLKAAQCKALLLARLVHKRLSESAPGSSAFAVEPHWHTFRRAAWAG